MTWTMGTNIIRIEHENTTEQLLLLRDIISLSAVGAIAPQIFNAKDSQNLHPGL